MMTPRLRKTATSELLFLFRGDHHGHLASFHCRHLLHHAMRFEILLNTLEQFDAKALMGHLPTPKSERDLGLVTLFKETYQVA